MTFKTRKRLAILVLFIGMPLYVIIAMKVLVRLPLDTPKLVEFVLYVVVGIAWIFPLKPLFLGIAREDPDAVKDVERNEKTPQ